MKGLALGGFAAVALVGLGAYILSPRVNENEIGMKIVRGALVDESVPTGLYPSALLPHVKINQFTRTLTTGEVQATQESDVTIRTNDKLRVFGGFKFKFLLEDKDPNWNRAFTFLKASDEGDMLDDIGDYLMPAAIDVYSTIPSDNINTDLIAIGERIRVAAQETLNEKGLTFIQLQDVIPTGMGLSPEADKLIEEQATESRRLSIDNTRRELANQQKQTILDQAEVTNNALTAFKDAGLTSAQALYALCLQQQRDADVVGQASPCIPAGSSIAVTASSTLQDQQQLAPTRASNPAVAPN